MTVTVKECYAAMGADYEGVVGRLRAEERVKKYLCMVPEDPSYDLLCRSVETEDMKEAYRAVDLLKGVSRNLSLTRLCQSSDRLADQLRDSRVAKSQVQPALDQVRRDYAHTVECIRQLQREEPKS
jgi:antitoxin component HigA of HigAB toxin-antitoxin module